MVITVPLVDHLARIERRIADAMVRRPITFGAHLGKGSELGCA